jgi:hypothetical protein
MYFFEFVILRDGNFTRFIRKYSHQVLKILSYKSCKILVNFLSYFRRSNEKPGLGSFRRSLEISKKNIQKLFLKNKEWILKIGEEFLVEFSRHF